MKKFVEILTQEQKEILKDSYILLGQHLYKMIENEDGEFMEDNFKVVFTVKKSIVVATADDITYFQPEKGDFDFKIGDSIEHFLRDGAPRAVVEFLDKKLNKTQYEMK